MQVYCYDAKIDALAFFGGGGVGAVLNATVLFSSSYLHTQYSPFVTTMSPSIQDALKPPSSLRHLQFLFRNKVVFC